MSQPPTPDPSKPGVTPPPASPPPGAQPHGWVLAPATPPKRRTGLIVGLLIGGVLLLCVCGGLVVALGDGDAQRPTASDTSAGTGADNSPGASGGSAEDTAPAAPGQPVRDGKFEFVVKDVRCGLDKVGNQYLNEKAQGQFCLVTLTVRNIGDEPQTFSDFDQRGYDAKGHEYKPDSESGIYANKDTDVWLNEINPGNKITGVLVFDIPDRTKLATLELHDSGFSGGVQVSL